MTSLKYRVREVGTGCLWEVFTEDRRTVASGTEASNNTAKAAAVLEGIRALQRLCRPQGHRPVETHRDKVGERTDTN
jgi:hypothetical protein